MPKADGLYFNANGETEFVFDGEMLTLRRPKIREFRELRERVLGLRNKVEVEIEEIEERKRTVTPEERAEAEDKILDWFLGTIEMLGKDPKPELEREDFPVWIYDPRNIPDMLAHWMHRPTAPGG